MPSFSAANRHHKVHNHSILLSQGISICSFVIIDMARMSVFGFWALILLAGTACLSSTYSSSHESGMLIHLVFMMTRINTPQNPCKVKFVLANRVLHFTNSYQSMSFFIYLYCNYVPGSQVELYMGLNVMNMSDLNFPRTEDSITATTSFKEPKEGCYSQRISSEEIQKDNINMEGYSKIDPTPKSTATIVFQTNRACMALLSYLTFQDQHCWITRSKAGSNHLLRLLNHFITSQKQVLTSDMVVLKYGAISKLRLFSEVLYQKDALLNNSENGTRFA
ncbi:hypothetical protein D5086_018248 [Populus alba]|uniref:Uncharacterized protein n=1 Tax=Populus alba TaxID=43335 RepID=A0ACC4BRA3_POPAL